VWPHYTYRTNTGGRESFGDLSIDERKNLKFVLKYGVLYYGVAGE